MEQLGQMIEKIWVGKTTTLHGADELAVVIWTRSAHLHTGPRTSSAAPRGLTHDRTRSPAQTVQRVLATVEASTHVVCRSSHYSPWRPTRRRSPDRKGEAPVARRPVRRSEQTCEGRGTCSQDRTSQSGWVRPGGRENRARVTPQVCLRHDGGRARPDLPRVKSGRRHSHRPPENCGTSCVVLCKRSHTVNE